MFLFTTDCTDFYQTYFPNDFSDFCGVFINFHHCSSNFHLPTSRHTIFSNTQFITLKLQNSKILLFLRHHLVRRIILNVYLDHCFSILQHFTAVFA